MSCPDRKVPSIDVILHISSVSNEFLVDFISNSISLDTTLVSKEDVQNILDGNTGNINSRVIQLVNNYLDGFLFGVALATKNEVFTENDLKDIHEKVVDGFSNGGLYRNVDISIKGSNHTPPSFIKVYDRMKKYFDTINSESFDVYYKIAFSHLQLMKVHPFLDGNGRLARIVLNCMLLHYGLKPIIIRYEEKEHYFEMLEDFKVNKNIDPFIDFIKSQQ